MEHNSHTTKIFVRRPNLFWALISGLFSGVLGTVIIQNFDDILSFGMICATLFFLLMLYMFLSNTLLFRRTGIRFTLHEDGVLTIEDGRVRRKESECNDEDVVLEMENGKINRKEFEYEFVESKKQEEDIYLDAITRLRLSDNTFIGLLSYQTYLDYTDEAGNNDTLLDVIPTFGGYLKREALNELLRLITIYRPDMALKPEN